MGRASHIGPQLPKVARHGGGGCVHGPPGGHAEGGDEDEEEEGGEEEGGGGFAAFGARCGRAPVDPESPI